MTKAWHLRQDGKAFPVKVHIYCMDDEDLSSEAEAAAFIINTVSKDRNLAEYVLDAWMAMLIEQEVSYNEDAEGIKDKIRAALKSLPYKFQYPLAPETLISIHEKSRNYDSVDTLYDFIDEVREKLTDIQRNIKRSFNQQFCRVRYGGQYNSVAGNNEIWFRVSSVGYNWANTIYVFTSSIRRAYNISQITICRDSESDESEVEYFYKAKDGTLYKHMSIEDYLAEEHEHNPVFENSGMNAGVIMNLKYLLSRGATYQDAIAFQEGCGVSYNKDMWGQILRQEKSKQCVMGIKENYRR